MPVDTDKWKLIQARELLTAVCENARTEFTAEDIQKWQPQDVYETLQAFGFIWNEGIGVWTSEE